MKRSGFYRALLAGVVAAGCASQAQAVGKASSPSISEGEWELEYEGVALLDGDDSKRKSSHEIELKYGVTDWFQPEVAFEYEDPANASGKIDAVGVGAQFVFIQPGTHWFDSAIRFVYEHKPHDDADVLKTKLLLQKEYGNFKHRANIDIEQELGDDAAAGGPEWSLVWSTRYAVSPAIAIGFEYDGEFGRSRNFDRYDDQAHYIGPAIYGKLGDEVGIEAGYLVGISEAAADGAARISLEYEF